MKHFTAQAESVERMRGAAYPVRVAAGRAHDMIGYIAIFASALSGYGGLGVWSIGATALALAALSYAEYGALYRRGQELGLTKVTQSALLQSLANALIATSAAYGMGWVFRLF